MLKFIKQNSIYSGLEYYLITQKSAKVKQNQDTIDCSEKQISLHSSYLQGCLVCKFGGLHDRKNKGCYFHVEIPH